MEAKKLVQLPTNLVKTQVELDYEKDVWDIRNLNIELNLSRAEYRLNFSGIKQLWLREAAKHFIRFSLATKSYSDCVNKIGSIGWFSKFLATCHSSIQPQEIDRSLMVEYFSYLLNQGLGVESRRKNIYQLRQFLTLCARESWLKITEKQIIFDDDTPKRKDPLPRYIPQEVLIQLNQHIDKLPLLIMRLVLVLQATGRRVGETCQLPFDCLLQDAQGDWFLLHYQSKMKQEDAIPITRETVAVVQEQQQCVREDYGDNCSYLFPTPRSVYEKSGGRRKGKPINQELVGDHLNRLAIAEDIRDSSGNIWRFQAHQFRHTVGTTMINNGVPIHIVKRFLGHISFEMTMRYAHIHDQTLKLEFAKFQGKVVNIAGQVIESENPDLDTTDLQWFKRNIQAQALPNGSCALPAPMKECPHANACLTCTHFRTTIEFLGQHQEQLQQTERLIEKARDNGWNRQVEMNERVANSLRNIISSLGDGNGN
jgi:integrase